MDATVAERLASLEASCASIKDHLNSIDQRLNLLDQRLTTELSQVRTEIAQLRGALKQQFLWMMGVMLSGFAALLGLVLARPWLPGP